MRAARLVLTIGLVAVAIGGVAVALGASTPSTERAAGAAAPARAGGSCNRSFVAPSVRVFLAAVNRGARSAVDSSIAQGRRFRVYSQTQRYGNSQAGFFSSGDRSRVVDHLLKRQAKGDRFRVGGLDPNGYDRAFEICNLGFVLKRRIAGGPWRPFVGKGALDHPSGAIAVWGVGGQCGRRAPKPVPCPDFGAGSKRSATVARGDGAAPPASARGDECPGIPSRAPKRRAFRVGGRVAFPPGSNARGWEQGDPTQASRYPGGRLFSKTALLARGADPIEVRVRSGGEITGWTSRRPTTAIVLSQGDRCAGTGWHAHPGGLLAQRPGGCVKLRVVVAGKPETVPFGVRRGC